MGDWTWSARCGGQQQKKSTFLSGGLSLDDLKKKLAPTVGERIGLAMYTNMATVSLGGRISPAGEYDTGSAAWNPLLLDINALRTQYNITMPINNRYTAGVCCTLLPALTARSRQHPAGAA